MIDAKFIARAMFDNERADYHFDPSLVEQMWHEDPGVQAFWLARAEFAIDLVRRTCMVCHPDLQTPGEVGGHEATGLAIKADNDEVDRSDFEIPGQLSIEDVPDAS